MGNFFIMSNGNEKRKIVLGSIGVELYDVTGGFIHNLEDKELKVLSQSIGQVVTAFVSAVIKVRAERSRKDELERQG